MPRRLPLLAVISFALLFTGSAWAQCAVDEVAIVADRDNTLYEDATGMLSNGAGANFFVGRTAQGSEETRRGLLHFDVASVVDPGLTIASATLMLNLNMAAGGGMVSVGLHSVESDWGEGTSVAGGGGGAGGPASAGDATWVNTFFSTVDWATPGGDFAAGASAVATVDSSTFTTYSWTSATMESDVQAWLDTPATNFGWLVQGDESMTTTAMRFASRENTGNEPILCLALSGPVGAEIPTVSTYGLMLLSLLLAVVALRRLN
jgi:hypothetical protein